MLRKICSTEERVQRSSGLSLAEWVPCILIILFCDLCVSGYMCQNLRNIKRCLKVSENERSKDVERSGWTFPLILNAEDSMQIDIFIIKAQRWQRANYSQNGIISLVTHPYKTLKCCLTFIGNCKSAQNYLKRSRDLENVLAKCSWVLWFYASRHKNKQSNVMELFRISFKENSALTEKKSLNIL